jgi:hypothetical protein
MGIDKPDVRFRFTMTFQNLRVIIRNGSRRSGWWVKALFSLLSYKDVEKLENSCLGNQLQSKKLVALLQEVVAYAETSMSRKFYCIILVKNLTVKRVKVPIWMTMSEPKSKN